jgi:hypothetical protein
MEDTESKSSTYVPCHESTVGDRGIALLLNLGTRWGWVVNATPRPLYPRESDPVPILQEPVWAPGPVWTGAENLASTEIRSPDCPARSESLYRLSYRGPRYWINTNQNQTSPHKF